MDFTFYYDPIQAYAYMCTLITDSVFQNVHYDTYFPQNSPPSKVMLQVYGSKHGDKMTIVSVLRHMLSEGGYRSMWRGNGINVVKIAPESAIKFMAYDKFKRMIKGDRFEQLENGQCD